MHVHLENAHVKFVDEDDLMKLSVVIVIVVMSNICDNLSSSAADNHHSSDVVYWTAQELNMSELILMCRPVSCFIKNILCDTVPLS